MRIFLKSLSILFLVLVFAVVSQAQETVQLFETTNLSRFGDGGLYLKLKKEQVKNLTNCRTSIKVQLPTQSGDVTAMVRPANLFADDFEVKNQKGKARKVRSQIHLQGEVVGRANSFVTISVDRKFGSFSDFIGATSSYDLTATIVTEDGLFSIVPQRNDIYQVLRDYHNEPFDCGGEHGSLDNLDFQQYQPKNKETKAANEDCKSIGISFVADYDFYQKRGNSIQGVTDYIANLFVNIQKIYERDGIDVKIKDITVFEKPDNFNSDSSIGALNSFAAWVVSNPTKGDVAHLLSPKGRGKGGVAYVDILCRASDRYQIGYSNIQLTYQNFPNYSWDVMVVTHELGHNFGSPHTQSCRWERNGLQNQSIDGCYAPEGTCGRGPIPQDGGTVMSYCHLQSVGINLLKGFGEQPSALIRQRIQAATCLQIGTCNDGGGDDDVKTDLLFNNASVKQDASKVIASVQVSNGAKAVTGVKVQFRLSKVKGRWNESDYSFGSVLVNIAENKTYSFALSQQYANINLPDGIYYMSAKVDSEDAISETNEANNIQYFQTPINIGAGDYCNVSAKYVVWDWIESTTIDRYKNTSTIKVGYSLTPTNYELSKDGEVGYLFSIGHRSTRPSNIYISSWVDWNGNKKFEDDEKVISDYGKSEIKGNFKIPSGAKTGATRMRVMMGKSSRDVTDPCLSYNWGQVKDFEFKIVGSKSDAPVLVTECWESSTSVVVDFVSEPFPEPHEKGGYYTLQYKKQHQDWGQAVTSQPIRDNSTYKLSNLEQDRFYQVRVKYVLDNIHSNWSKVGEIETRGFCRDIQYED